MILYDKMKRARVIKLKLGLVVYYES